jgi:TetR/AcrR family transcriptional regulator
MAAGGDRGTRARILEVAEAFFGESGYHGARLHLIARQVGIQKASLFHYFPSKESLYRAVIDEGFGETDVTIRRVLEAAGTPFDKLRLLLEAYVDMVAAHPARTKILLRQSLGDAPNGTPHTGDSQRLLDLIVQFLRDGQQAQTFEALDPVALVLGIVGTVAFLFTSAPVLAPAWCDDPWSPAYVERVKHHVVQVVERCLTPTERPHVSVRRASA